MNEVKKLREELERKHVLEPKPLISRRAPADLSMIPAPLLVELKTLFDEGRIHLKLERVEAAERRFEWFNATPCVLEWLAAVQGRVRDEIEAECERRRSNEAEFKRRGVFKEM